MKSYKTQQGKKKEKKHEKLAVSAQPCHKRKTYAIKFHNAYLDSTKKSVPLLHPQNHFTPYSNTTAKKNNNLEIENLH